MTPNLRYNKSLTRKLIKSIPDSEFKPTLLNIEWNMENGHNVYGLKHEGLFKTTVFFLQRLEENRYRLVVSDGQPICSFYIIDDIEKFLNVVGVEILELDNAREIRKALEETVIVPNTGIMIINEDEIFIYDHANY